MIKNNSNSLAVFPVIVPVSNGLKSVNFFLAKQESSLTLIDAGMNTDECWEALQNTLKQNSYSLRDITGILLTHHHSDHVGLVNRVVAKHVIPVYAHSNALPRLKRDPEFLQMRVEFYKNLYEEMGCGEMGDKQVTYLQNALIQNKNNQIYCEIQEITDNQLLNLEIIETPGHAPDQVAYYHKEQKWLFGGDLLIDHISSNALVEPDFFGKRIKTLKQHKHSLKATLALNAELVFSGHGIVIENSDQLIQKRLKGMDEKADMFKNYIKSGISTASEMAQARYKERYEKQFSLVMSEIIGHLDHLEDQGEIKKEFDKGIWHYFVN